MKKLAEKADGQSFVGEEPVVKSDFGDPEDSPEGYRWDPMIANEQNSMMRWTACAWRLLKWGGFCWIGPVNPKTMTSIKFR